MIPDPATQPTLRTDEAAALFDVSAEHLLRLARRGEAPVEPLRLGRALRWPTRAVLGSLGLADPPEAA